MSALKVVAALLVGSTTLLVILLGVGTDYFDPADEGLAPANAVPVVAESEQTADSLNQLDLEGSERVGGGPDTAPAVLMPIPPPDASLGISTAAPMEVGNFIDPSAVPPVNSVPKTVGAFINPEEDLGLDTTASASTLSVGEFRIVSFKAKLFYEVYPAILAVATPALGGGGVGSRLRRYWLRSEFSNRS